MDIRMWIIGVERKGCFRPAFNRVTGGGYDRELIREIVIKVPFFFYSWGAPSHCGKNADKTLIS